MDDLVQRMRALPLSIPGGSINRVVPVEARVADRHEVAMPVCNVSFIVGINSVVGIVRTHVHRLLEVFKILRLRTQPRLHQSFHRTVLLLQRDPHIISLSNHRTMNG